ncbi:MAG TPA: PSD1 and planctomycete cytochrome C domain-containing protein, partial [Opitutaceae bacterium]|nr:PSD1 and planctomycete cytochrome C domain-containing protein [Opitutaceae bacterium]
MEDSPIRRAAVAALVLALAAGCARQGATSIAATGPVDFNRDIRPIFNQSCVACHGGVKMAGKISFVFREEATRAGDSGRITIKPGDPAGSELIARISSNDLKKRMPPADHAAALTPAQVDLFRQWIKEGAKWSEHWAFVPPKAPNVPSPAAATATAAHGAIDRFVLARLEKEKLSPAKEETPAVLLRRLSLDLTGLPPSPAEVDAFVGDKQPGAYERQVDRLLASPHFGERWAAPWLDLARYSDTKGYEKDAGRTIWKYRDWVIDALNRNLPYDQFIVEQLAGDLLPEGTLEQKIATAFHRNTQTNDEGGTDDEEFRLAAVLDRVSTTWIALNGVTFNCVQCHSHPYDPIRHEEFYRFAAFFNGTVDVDLPSEYPTLRIPDAPEKYAEADELQREMQKLRDAIVAPGKALAAETAQWRPLPVAAAESMPAARFRLSRGEAFAEGTVAQAAVFSLRASAAPAGTTAVRVEVAPLDPEKARHTPEHGFVVTKLEATLTAADGQTSGVPIARFFADSSNQPDVRIAAPASTPARKNAPATKAGKSRPAAGATPAPALAATEPPAEETAAPGPTLFLAANPALQQTRWAVVAFAEPLTIPAGGTLTLKLSHGRQIASRPAVARRVRLSASADARWTALARDSNLVTAEKKLAEISQRLNAVPGTVLPVLAELAGDERREMRRFNRGNFLEKTGPALEPGTPALFPPLPEGKRDRLALARWFVAPGQPLTARVAVNRFWEQLFGVGLVETLEDFGSVGEAPSHPELLDWLALRFERDLHWDVKALLREIVTSATYRQSAQATSELTTRDPRNRLLARGPRNRLGAEMVRDQALTASGLLTAKLHGPPVMPPQPAGVWASVYSAAKWEDAAGPERYRRAVYTYQKRTSAYPSFVSFDAPSRESCTVRRVPTNTPLQAFVTLNDPAFVEMAQALGARVLREGGTTLQDRIRYALELCLVRSVSEEQVKALEQLYLQEVTDYQ